MRTNKTLSFVLMLTICAASAKPAVAYRNGIALLSSASSTIVDLNDTLPAVQSGANGQQNSVSSTITPWSGQVPDGYYDNVDLLEGAALKTALYKIIAKHDTLSYGNLWTAFKTTDLRDNGTIWDIYSQLTAFEPGNDQCGSYKVEGDCYNREHTFPKSWFGNATPMYTDLMHLLPTDGKVNSERSNLPYGETDGENFKSSGGYSKVGYSTIDGYSGLVFEPADEYKGDLARIYFYMATAYEDKVANWSSPMLNGTIFPAFAPWALNMLLSWAANDPVSQKEIDRNNAVYSIQGNRNPYVDYPDFADLVWGTPAADLCRIGTIIHNPTSPTGNDEVIVSVAINNAVKATLQWGTSADNISNTIKMAADNGKYTATIPANNDGTVVYYYIVAENNNGDKLQSLTQNYTVSNSTVNINTFAITNITQTPQVPNNTEEVNISATIANAIEATLHWGISANNINIATSMSANGDMFSTTMFAHLAGTTIYYYISATDGNNQAMSDVMNYTVEKSASTGIVHDKPNIGLSPVPVINTLNIVSPTDQQCKMLIYNTSGKLMYEYPYCCGSLSVDCSDWPAGIYIASFIFDDCTINRKICK